MLLLLKILIYHTYNLLFISKNLQFLTRTKNRMQILKGQKNKNQKFLEKMKKKIKIWIMQNNKRLKIKQIQML